MTNSPLAARISPHMLRIYHTAKWAGTPLAPLLQEAEVLDQGIEVVFVGSDAGEEEVRGIKMQQNFARSMSLADALNPLNLLCYEMNGGHCPSRRGSPCDSLRRPGTGSPT
jgi:DMSO/TMAO reductase YedYZ molybdopterin-dependent catalytic subunit